MPYNPTLGVGVSADGEQATTIQWGTSGAMASSANAGASFYVVLDVQAEQSIAFREDLPNGDGITSTRIIGLNGVTWRVSVREDSRFVAPIVGVQVYLADWTGYLGTRGQRYRGRVVDNNFNQAIKQAGVRNIIVERFALIDS